MTEHGHCHTQATVAVARKLVERTWTVLTRGQPYQLRDLDGQPISHLDAKKLIKERCTVPDHRSDQGPSAQRRHQPSQTDPLTPATTTRPILR